MILAAALLVVLALGFFVGGVVTGLTGLYWACVAVSAVAAVLLVLARRRPAGSAIERPAADDDAPAEDGVAVTPAAASVAATGHTEAAPRRSPERAVEPAEAPAAPARHASTAEFPVPEPTAENMRSDGPAAGDPDDPAVEEVEVTDLLLVVDLTDDVLVVDEHPRYHLADCSWLAGRPAIPMPMDEARTDGFTPCALCAPDRHMAEVARARKASG